MADLLTYDGWAAQGKKITGGAKAEFYLASPDGTKHRALFSANQTEDIDAVDGIWTTIIPAAERPNNKGDKRPKLKVSYDGETLAIWCGPNKKAIASFKKDGFKFERYEHRWTKTVNLAWYEKALEAYELAGFNVQVES